MALTSVLNIWLSVEPESEGLDELCERVGQHRLLSSSEDTSEWSP